MNRVLSQTLSLLLLFSLLGSIAGGLADSLSIRKRNLQTGNSGLNLTNANLLLDQLEIEVPTTGIDTQSQKQTFFGGSLKMKIFVGGLDKLPGSCSDFGLTGGLRVFGEPLEPLNGNQRVKFTILGEGLQFKCQIPLLVKADDLVIAFIKVNLGAIQDTKEGIMTINTKEGAGLTWTQSLVLESPDFTKFSPTIATPGDCNIDPGELDFNAKDVLELFDNILPNGINLDKKVEEGLRKDAEAVAAPLNDGLCNLTFGLAEQLGKFVIDNPLTETDVSSILSGGGFLDTDGNGFTQTEDLENELVNGLNQSLNLLDLSGSNFLVKALFPENSNEEKNLIEEFLDSFEVAGVEVQQNDAIGLAIALLNDAFDLGLTAPLTDVPLLTIIKTILDDTGSADDPAQKFFKDVDGEIVLVPFNDTIAFEDLIEAKLSFVIKNVLLSENGGTDDDIGIFTGIDVVGNHTLLFPSFDMGNVVITADIDFDFSFVANLTAAGAENFTKDGVDVIAIDFGREVLDLEINLTSLFGAAAGLLVINEDLLMNLQLGSLLDNALNCSTSVLANDVIITGLGVSAAAVQGLLSGFEDAIAGFVGDVANTLLLAYQSVILRALETALSQALIADEPLVVFERGECERVVEGPDANDPFDFSRGIFQNIVSAADAEFFEEAIKFLAGSSEDGSVSLITPDDPIEFGMKLIPVDGFRQSIDFLISEVNVFGISPPDVTFGEISVPRSSEFFPQGIVVEASVGSPERLLGAEISLTISISEPAVDPDADPEEIADEPPAQMLGTSSSTDLTIRVDLASIDAFVELFASLTKFGVESTTIEDAIVIDCWVSKLQPFGGFSERSDVFPVLSSASGVCTNCGNATTSGLLQRTMEAVSQVNGFGELNFDIGRLASAFINQFPNKFNEENFAFTVESATSVCNGGPKLSKALVFEEAEHHAEEAYVFIMILAVILLSFLVPCWIVNCCNRNKDKKRSILEPADPNHEPDENFKEEDEQDAAMRELTKKAELNKYLEDNKNYSEKVPMYKNHHIPFGLRIMLPALLCLNLGLFLYGDFGVSITISFEGSFLEAILAQQQFGEFSVISSTIDLFENGAIGLAILIFVVAIFFPYAKLILLTFCLFTTKMGIKGRGKLLTFLDAFGKWSFVEIFFVSFLRILFEVSVSSPRTLYLPDEDLYGISLLITPQLSFYTFAIAVVLSIVASNIMVIYHEKIVRKNQDDLRNVLFMEGTSQAVFISMEMKNYKYFVDMRKKDGSPSYVYQLTTRGINCLTIFTLICIGLTLAATSAHVVIVEFLGLASFALRVSDAETELKFSVVNLVAQIYSKGAAEGDFGAIALATLLVGATIVAPMARLCSSLYILHFGTSLARGRKFGAWREVLSAWCSLEVFILVVAFSVIEVPVLAAAIVPEECDFVQEFMADSLLPMGLVTEEDVVATCFGIKETIPFGGYFFLFALFCNVMNGYIITTLYHAMIDQRKGLQTHVTKEYVNTATLDPLARLDNPEQAEEMHYSFSIRISKKLGLVSAYRKDDGVST